MRFVGRFRQRARRYGKVTGVVASRQPNLARCGEFHGGEISAEPAHRAVAASDECRIDQSAAGGIELGEERGALCIWKFRLERSRRNGKVGRCRLTGDKNITRRINRYRSRSSSV